MKRIILTLAVALPTAILLAPTAVAVPVPDRVDGGADSARPAALMGLAGSYTTQSGDATITWRVTGARPVTKPKPTYRSASGIATPGDTVTVTGTLTFVGVPRLPSDTYWSDVRQGVWLEGAYFQSRSFAKPKVGQTTATVGAGVPVTYDYTISIKVPKKVPAAAAKWEKQRKGLLGEIKGTFFSHACTQSCSDSLSPYDAGDTLYMSIAILRK